MLKDDFLQSNGQKQMDNKTRRDAERDDYHRNKLDYFPFVSGEMLDQHRQGLTGQMRADLKNYLIAKSQGVVGRQNTQSTFHKTASSRFQSSGRMTPNSLLNPKMEGHIDLR